MGNSIVIEVNKKYENEFLNNFSDVYIKKIGYTINDNIIINDDNKSIIKKK